MAEFDERLLARVEDACLNAAAPPQQRWLDGWLVRCSPGKAKRARSIHALAEGRLSLDERLALARPLFDAAGVPMLFRIHRFTCPATLDADLAARGFGTLDDTRVMVCAQPDIRERSLPAGVAFEPLNGAAFAEAVGVLRGSPAAQREAHAQRLLASPVAYRGWALRREGEVLACGQIAAEAGLVGLYDVFTRDDQRGSGLATLLCERLLLEGLRGGTHIAYLQCEADNAPARRIYQRLGFADAYAYHYRQAP